MEIYVSLDFSKLRNDEKTAWSKKYFLEADDVRLKLQCGGGGGRDRTVRAHMLLTMDVFINLDGIRTVKVSNVSLGATKRDITEFFGFSGEINYVEMRGNNETSQVAYVTFKDQQGAETAVLLSGATIVDLPVNIELDPDYVLPPDASVPSTAENRNVGGPDSAFRKAEDVVSSMLARGFILGKDTVTKARTFDQKHQLTSTASAKFVSFDQKIGLSQKISSGASTVGDKVREVDQKFQVSDKTRSAFAAAEQKVSSASSAIMKNRHVLTGVSWVTNAFNRVRNAAEDVGQKTKEKVELAGKREIVPAENQNSHAQALPKSPGASVGSEQPHVDPAAL